MGQIEHLLDDILGELSGGGVEIEPLLVTANGTYTADEGKAYSPVVVNIPAAESVLF